MLFLFFLSYLPLQRSPSKVSGMVVQSLHMLTITGGLRQTHVEQLVCLLLLLVLSEVLI